MNLPMNRCDFVHLIITARDGRKQASGLVSGATCLDAAREFARLLPRTATIGLYVIDVPAEQAWRRSGVAR